MFELTVKRRFAAAHRLLGYSGECATLHGHTWTVQVEVSGERLDSCGMLIDFKIIKEMIDGIIAQLDHNYLNDIDYFRAGVNPTAENLALFIFEKLKERLSGFSDSLSICGVRVWESPDASAYYREGR
ncbi:MAG: 6-carboxytetrahydropterin synthase QueD [Bacillota bacterium]